MRIKLKRLEQQVVVIIGASSGVGRLAALEFGRCGAKVVVSSRGEEALLSLVNEIKEKGGEAISVVADTADAGEVNHVAEEAIRAYGRIDTWVQNAAIPLFANFMETTPEEFKRVIDVNLNGAAYGAMAALNSMYQEGGALIFISSLEAETNMPYQSAYAASKHGMQGMVEVLRLEIKHQQIPVSITNIKPAYINTPFFNHARTKLGVKPKPMHPIYEPEAVVRAICYAATHPIDEINVGGAGTAIIWMKKMAPRLFDFTLSMIAFRGQRSKESKPLNATDNLWNSMPSDSRIHGDFGRMARSWSARIFMMRHPLLRRAALLGMAAAGAAYMMSKRPRKTQPGAPLSY